MIKKIFLLVLISSSFLLIVNSVKAQDIASNYTNINSAIQYTPYWSNFENIYSEDGNFSICKTETSNITDCILLPFFQWNDVPDQVRIKSLDIRIKGHHPGRNLDESGRLSFHINYGECTIPRGVQLGGSKTLASTIFSLNRWHEVHVDFNSNSNYLGFDLKNQNYCITLRLGNINNVRMWLVDNIQARVTYEQLSSLTPTPTPSGPVPFLDLPWDYSSKGLSFSEAALRMTSYFDHEYPLLSFSSLNESQPEESKNTVVAYDSIERTDKLYSSHDGYDYAAYSRANLGDNVLAAADGLARFVNTCKPCGNAIYVDHDKGFQTRYYHLQSDGLITSIPNIPIQVAQGEPIGKVGFTGNTTGAHIHFMVIEDKDKDGNFDNNIPDGVLDPYGWQPQSPDPWEQYAFSINNQSKIGNKSYYLWKTNLDGTQQTIGDTGETMEVGKYTVTLPPSFYTQTLIVKVNAAPTARINEALESLGSSVVITAQTLAGQLITQFNKVFTLEIDFSGEDLTGYDPDSIALYSSQDGRTWTKIDSNIDMFSKKATAELDHLTHFALFAEQTDTTPPVTTTILTGTEGKDNWFRSNVQVALNAQDEGVGSAYTAYRLDGGDWQEYASSLLFGEEGAYTVEYYSVDQIDNIETPKSVTFHIDKTTPEARIFYNLHDNNFIFEGTDSASFVQVYPEDLGDKQKQYTFVDQAGNTVKLVVREWVKELPARLQFESLSYNEDVPISLSQYDWRVHIKTDKSEALKELSHLWNIFDVLKIKLKYDSKSDTTKVISAENGTEAIKTILDGLYEISLYTKNGELEYSY